MKILIKLYSYTLIRLNWKNCLNPFKQAQDFLMNLKNMHFLIRTEKTYNHKKEKKENFKVFPHHHVGLFITNDEFLF